MRTSILNYNKDDMEYRGEILRLFREEGLSERRIARYLRLSHSIVHYWIQKEGQKGKRGRPRVTDAHTDSTMFEESVKSPFKPAVDLRMDLRLECSVSTVRRRLKEKGLRCRIPARKPALKPVHVEKRYNFAFNHMDWDLDRWNRVVFSDEKIFRATCKGPLRVYRPYKGSDRYDARYIVPSSNVHHNKTLQVWVAFNGNGAIRTIQRVTQNMTSAYYTQNILPVIENDLVMNDLIYMHDLSPIHTSLVTRQWLQNHNIPVMEDWPPKGADLNPVENVWAEIVRRITRDSRNKEELWEMVQATFNQLGDEYFTKLVESMPRRMQEVRDRNGSWTHY